MSCFQMSPGSRLNGVNNFGCSCLFRFGTAYVLVMSAAGFSGSATMAFCSSSERMTAYSSTLSFQFNRDVLSNSLAA